MYSIRYNVSLPSKLFEVNQDEELFFSCLSKKLTVQQNKSIRLTRMSNGTLDVYYGGYPIGKIKLQGRKHTMQILKGLYGNESIDGTVEDFIQHIDSWLKYIKRL